MAKKETAKRISITEENLNQGLRIIQNHTLFGSLDGWFQTRSKEVMGSKSAAQVNSGGDIFLNKNYNLEPMEWAYVIAHCLLHLAFGHFDLENMPQHANKKLWNMACDIYVTKFLWDMKFGKPPAGNMLANYSGSLADEKKIYQHLLESGTDENEQLYGTAAISSMDMIGLENPLVYDKDKGERNYYVETFGEVLAYSARESISIAGGHGKLTHRSRSKADETKEWFVNHYPMLGSLAAAFTIEYDSTICMREEVSIGAIDIDEAKIYINPAAKLSLDEMKFVMAHELLHAGLSHSERRQGRDPYLWNVACDYVINGWLNEMQIGTMPSRGLLYDEKFKNISAESIYDEILTEMRKYSKLDTLRGYGKGDMFERSSKSSGINGVSVDEFCRNALSQGLEYHISHGRGFIPAGLVEEIRALAMPAIPWDVQLAMWFDCQFPPLEKHRTYARPSRRQSSTPDIPRPRSVLYEVDKNDRTFGVVVDTSGSMSAHMLGKALGSIASFAAAKDVPFVRVVYCDAHAYDAGYMAPEEIAGKVEVKGRGGTVLQPAVDLLEKADDFPVTGPILIITDGYIETTLRVRHEHAYLLPKGNRLPFKAKGEVFYFE